MKPVPHAQFYYSKIVRSKKKKLFDRVYANFIISSLFSFDIYCNKFIDFDYIVAKDAQESCVCLEYQSKYSYQFNSNSIFNFNCSSHLSQISKWVFI